MSRPNKYMRDVRMQGPRQQEHDASDGLWLWLILCILIFACIMVNYWAGIQVGVE